MIRAIRRACRVLRCIAIFNPVDSDCFDSDGTEPGDPVVQRPSDVPGLASAGDSYLSSRFVRGVPGGPAALRGFFVLGSPRCPGDQSIAGAGERATSARGGSRKGAAKIAQRLTPSKFRAALNPDSRFCAFWFAGGFWPSGTFWLLRFLCPSGTGAGAARHTTSLLTLRLWFWPGAPIEAASASASISRWGALSFFVPIIGTDRFAFIIDTRL